MQAYLVQVGPDEWVWSCGCGRISDCVLPDVEVARIDLRSHIRDAHRTVAA